MLLVATHFIEKDKNLRAQKTSKNVTNSKVLLVRLSPNSGYKNSCSFSYFLYRVFYNFLLFFFSLVIQTLISVLMVINTLIALVSFLISGLTKPSIWKIRDRFVYTYCRVDEHLDLSQTRRGVDESLHESFINSHVLVKREQELHES